MGTTARSIQQCRAHSNELRTTAAAQRPAATKNGTHDRHDTYSYQSIVGIETTTPNVDTAVAASCLTYEQRLHSGMQTSPRRTALDGPASTGRLSARHRSSPGERQPSDRTDKPRSVPMGGAGRTRYAAWTDSAALPGVCDVLSPPLSIALAPISQANGRRSDDRTIHGNRSVVGNGTTTR
ncbi:hypothetical protein BJ912DRAFT_1054521 [Pholiota molesta]|nr:hypothetical protein BJ912DRAFT_1054521 [Pholiota molesta]